jgi:hypothetical protein
MHKIGQRVLLITFRESHVSGCSRSWLKIEFPSSFHPVDPCFPAFYRVTSTWPPCFVVLEVQLRARLGFLSTKSLWGLVQKGG